MPIVTLPSSSLRSHSCSLVKRRSPGNSLICFTPVEGQSGNETDQETDLDVDECPALADERRLHDAHIKKFPSHVYFCAFVIAGRKPRQCNRALQCRRKPAACDLKSEEHTSELQSREKLVCRLL